MLLSIKESLVKLDLVANLVNTYVEVSDLKKIECFDQY